MIMTTEINEGKYIFQGKQFCNFRFCLPSLLRSTVIEKNLLPGSKLFPLFLMHSERPKLYGVLAVLSAIGFKVDPILDRLCCQGK